MDILRCKTPEMVNKEILMHFIAYNCIRNLVNEVATKFNVNASRISFKGSIQALRQWEPHLNQKTMNKKERIRLIETLHYSIAEYIAPERPGRKEPRCIKRRPKSYQLLTEPRHQMQEVKHRSRYHARAALT